jgi:hypothetical protein
MSHAELTDKVKGKGVLVCYMIEDKKCENRDTKDRKK